MASDAKGHRSRFHQQPSPKRSRRNGKVEIQRPPLGSKLDSITHSGQELKRIYHTGDSVPLQKLSDEDQGGWKDSRAWHVQRSSRTASRDTRRKEHMVKAHGEDDGHWRPDKFSELQSRTNPSARKRPAFREHKVAAEAVKTERTAADPQKPNHSKRPASESEKQNVREGHNYSSWDRRERPPIGVRGEADRKDIWKGKFPSTYRYGDDNRRDRFAATQGNRLGGGIPEKWKHDLFDEANRGPPRKSEEDQIAKVEALLAS
ncbi:hypothetical protein LIER_34387 [Lithospermum erythrorhizon]|uniref:Btz domain-containing protein n=1 Tax=Lithospermum erythrorhizon TaxID=34254 RepID=A0AAV3S2V2_LITER